jgi:cobalt-zinc-cadmium efflux system protein
MHDDHDHGDDGNPSGAGHRHGAPDATPSQGHGHHHHAASGDANVAVAVAVNLVLTAAQVAGGIAAGSVALIADAVHNLSDAVSLVIAFAARRIARRAATPEMSFGYGRAEVVAALVNYTTLIVISVWLGYEAVARLVDPPVVTGWIVVALAAVALAVNSATALLTWRLAKDSVNIRAAFLHNLSDAGTSLAVILGGILISLYGWRWVDPAVTLAISGWILIHALHEIGPVIRILMLGAPEGADIAAIRDRIEADEAVEGTHHIHLWQIDEHRASFEAHLVLRDGADAALAAHRIKRLLRTEFGLSHATLECETPSGGCAGGGC